MQAPLPKFKQIEHRFRLELLLAQLNAAFLFICALLLMATLIFVWLPAVRVSMLLAILLPCLAVGAGLLWLGVSWWRRPDVGTVVRRADLVLGLEDRLTTLHELPDQEPWLNAVLHNTEDELDGREVAESWPVKPGRLTWWTGGAALVMLVVCMALGLTRAGEGRQIFAQLEAENESKAAILEEVLDDWTAFVDETEDEKLKEIFEEALGLNKALKDRDPLALMLEMSRLEEAMAAMAQSAEEESMGAEAQTLAQALEGIEGMSALAAALRSSEFGRAAHEADQQAEKAKSRPEDVRKINAADTVADLFNAAAAKMRERGMDQPASAAGELSKSVGEGKNTGNMPASAFQRPISELGDEFRKEEMLGQRGRLLKVGQDQLEAMRQRLRGEPPPGAMPSMCMAAGMTSGNGEGDGIGAGAGSDVFAEQTEAIAPGTAETLTGTLGEGESETSVTATTTGAGGNTRASQESALAKYDELSRSAVGDESIPMAYRESIRDYFERIRPVGDE